jgi:hypothetical protein
LEVFEKSKLKDGGGEVAAVTWWELDKKKKKKQAARKMCAVALSGAIMVQPESSL